MFNFKNLSDYEFEVLCKDILEIKTNKVFNTFAKGKDGGVDIRGLENEKMVAQVKHYICSPVSNLIGNLKKEVEKINKLSFEEYYLFTSKSLSAKKIDEIYLLFQNIMSSKENIFDEGRLESLLKQEEYLRVVKEHYKLWLASSNILDIVFNRNIFIDTEELMFEIKEESKLFVKTSAYHNAFKILNEDRLVIIQGNPGVGKTIISKMLILFYASENYIVRYASDNSVKELKKAISCNPDLKEIILVDDFLGQHYLSLKENQTNEINALVSYIMRNPNKRLILNTRITIFKEAMRINHKFKTFMEKDSIKKYLINVDEMSLVEKAKVFYNHLYFKELPQQHFKDLLINNRYMDIIQHKNYNPRVIEFVTTKSRYLEVENEKYYIYILENLDNPKDVWDQVFEENIEIVDRILLFCLYSLTNNVVCIEVLETAFLHWINNIEIDKTKDQYGNSLKRLSESMIKLIDMDGKHFVGVINPSVNDYLQHKIASTISITYSILKNATYIEQIYKIKMLNKKIVDDYIDKLIKSHNFFNLKGLSYTIDYYFLKEIENKVITEENLKERLHKIVISKDTYNTPNYEYYKRESSIFKSGSSFVIKILNNDVLYNFYNLNKLIFNIDNVYKMMEHMGLCDITSLVLIFKKLYDNSEEFWDSFIIDLEKAVSDNVGEKIENNILFELKDELTELIVEAFNSTGIKYIEGMDDELIQIVEEEIRLEISERLDFKNKKIGCNFITVKGQIDEFQIFSNLDISTEIDILVNNEPDDYYVDDFTYENNSLNSMEENDISMIFNREYNIQIDGN